MSIEENKAIVRHIFEDSLNKGEVDAIAALTAPDFLDHGIHVETGITGGPEGMREVLVAVRRGIPDIHVTIEDVVAEDDKVVVRNTWRGTHEGEFNGIPATGRRVEITGIVIWRGYRLGLLVEILKSGPPWHLGTVMSGNLEGTGTSDLKQREEVTAARWIWAVETRHPLLNLLEPVSKPLFAWSHRNASERGRRGLKNLLKARPRTKGAKR